MIRALVLGLALAVAGCATTKPNLVTVDLWAYRADSGVVMTEAILAQQGALTVARSKEILSIAQPVAQLGLQISRVLRAWDPTQPVPPQLPALVDELYRLVRLVIALLPKDQARALADAPMVQPRDDLDATLDRLIEDWTDLLADIDRRLEELNHALRR